MKINELISNLQSVVKAYGEDLEVVYSVDEEGNAFLPVNFSPSAGNFEDNEFKSDDTMLEDNEDLPINAVCIN